MKEAITSFKNKFYSLIGKIKKFAFQFYIPKKNKSGKPFMKTPCNHFFHSQCLESWFNQKKECPTCRSEIEDY